VSNQTEGGGRGLEITIAVGTCSLIEGGNTNTGWWDEHIPLGLLLA
jgi:hypothetical protein